MHKLLRTSVPNDIVQYTAKFSLDFNQNPESKTVDKGDKFLFPVPTPITIPPGLPAFYGWQDTELKTYYEPGQELYPTRNASYKGVFNVGRPIRMAITNNLDQKYSIFFTSFWHTEVVENDAPPFSSDIPDATEYTITATVPQLFSDYDGQDYRMELELIDENDRFASFGLARDGDVFKGEITAAYVDINHLKFGCKLALTYKLIKVWQETF